MTAASELAREVSELRAGIGRNVAARLAGAGVQAATGHQLTVWYQEDFLSGLECSQLIGMIEQVRQPSELLSDSAGQSFRTSESGNLERFNPLVAAIDRRICTLLGMDERCGETLQGQRYGVGQFFRPHHDFFHTDQSYWPEQQATGGQRTWTAMIYLNEPGAGGETAFDAAGVVVPPRAGMLIAWDNMDANGAPNPYASHEGRAVTQGAKHIVTKWYRERFWF